VFVYQATGQVIDRIAPGLSQYMISESLKVTPFAVLSRFVSKASIHSCENNKNRGKVN
jgi:molybdopterin biosynthesis enzyme MoaB